MTNEESLQQCSENSGTPSTHSEKDEPIVQVPTTTTCTTSSSQLPDREKNIQQREEALAQNEGALILREQGLTQREQG